MSKNESRLLDWQVRYQKILGVRFGDRQIERALASLVKDISAFRSDISVQQFEKEGQDLGKYIIVGDLQKAKQVICTSYDTPMRHFGGYHFFNQAKQSKNALTYTILTTLLWVVVGIGFIFAYQTLANIGHHFPMWQLIIIGVIVFVYFFILAKLAKGLPRKQNAVRNTSSLLVMLDLISEIRHKNTAFVFIPNGSYGMQSLQLLEELVTNKQKLLYLDSIGSNQPIYHFSRHQPTESEAVIYKHHNQRVDYLISARLEDGNYYLTQSDLGDKVFDLDKIQQLSEYIRRL